MATTARADDLGRPPATLNTPDDARPIEAANAGALSSRSSAPIPSSARWSGQSGSVGGDTSNAWKLRWRQPTGATQVSSSDPQPLAVARAVVWNQTGAKSSSTIRNSGVRLATQLAPVDPFEEPTPAPTPAPNRSGSARSFQGRAGTIPVQQPNVETPPAAETPPAGEAAPAELAIENPPKQDLFGPPKSDPADAAPPTGQDSPQPPAIVAPTPEGDLAPVPPADLAKPDAFLRPVPDEMPCNRTYNERNCCADDARCRQARDFVARYRIDGISLDITPNFTNTENTNSQNFVPTDVLKEQELAKAPSRSWKNRAGEMIADGRFTNYQNGYVHILSDGGKTAQVPYADLSDDDLCFVTAWWSLPTECTLANDPFRSRDWLASTLTWKASALCHKPLYFEEVALERYGHSVGPIKQPFVSGAHFFGSILALPYQMGIHPPTECQYALGYYRPGDCAPWLIPPFPVSLRGALAEAGVIVGGIYIVP